MTKSRPPFLFPLLLLLFVTTCQEITAQTFPAKIRNSLNQKYSGWKLHSGDPICKSRAVVSGDFDGNKKTDYAVMFNKGRTGYIVAFLANGADYKAVVLENGPAIDMKNSFLTVALKGRSYFEIINDDLDRAPTQKLKTDSPVSGACEASEYIYVYNKGKFKQVFTSD